MGAKRFLTVAGLVGCLGAGAGGAWAQTGPAPSPAPITPLPLAAPPGTSATPPAADTPAVPAPPPATAQNPAPADALPAQSTPAPAPVTPSPPPPGTAPAAPRAPSVLPTLVDKPGDPQDVDDVQLAPKTAAVLAGQSTWDDGFTTLKETFQTIERELAKAGLAPSGRPLAIFLETDDNGFRFEAMIPAAIPPGRTSISDTIRVGTTPSGRALRFVHVAPYDEIDSTYETITAYLDAKNIVVRDSFMEEYVGDFGVAGDDIEINVFTFPR